MKYILKLDNGTKCVMDFDGSHADAIKKFTGTRIGDAQVVVVYKK